MKLSKLSDELAVDDPVLSFLPKPENFSIRTSQVKARSPLETLTPTASTTTPYKFQQYDPTAFPNHAFTKSITLPSLNTPVNTHPRAAKAAASGGTPTSLSRLTPTSSPILNQTSRTSPERMTSSPIHRNHTTALAPLPSSGSPTPYGNSSPTSSPTSLAHTSPKLSSEPVQQAEHKIPRNAPLAPLSSASPPPHSDSHVTHSSHQGAMSTSRPVLPSVASPVTATGNGGQSITTPIGLSPLSSLPLEPHQGQETAQSRHQTLQPLPAKGSSSPSPSNVTPVGGSHSPSQSAPPPTEKMGPLQPVNHNPTPDIDRRRSITTPVSSSTNAFSTCPSFPGMPPWDVEFEDVRPDTRSGVVGTGKTPRSGASLVPTGEQAPSYGKLIELAVDVVGLILEFVQEGELAVTCSWFWENFGQLYLSESCQHNHAKSIQLDSWASLEKWKSSLTGVKPHKLKVDYQSSTLSTSNVERLSQLPNMIESNAKWGTLHSLEIDMHKTHLGAWEEGVAILAKIIQMVSTLRALTLRMGYCTLKDKDLVPIMSAIECNQRLSKLCLALQENPNIDDDGVETICKAVTGLKWLRRLYLSLAYDRVSSTGFHMLGDMVKECTRMQQLNLQLHHLKDLNPRDVDWLLAAFATLAPKGSASALQTVVLNVGTSLTNAERQVKEAYCRERMLASVVIQNDQP